MLSRPLTTLLVALVTAVSVAGAAHSQGAFGRLLLVITDQDGKPVEGVKVTATCEELSDYLEQRETNKKGKLMLAFADGTKVYDIKIEYPGVAAMEAPFKPVLRKTITREITLSLDGGGEVTSAEPVTGGELSLRPSERIFNSGIELVEAGDYEGARDKFLQAIQGMPDLAAGYSALSGVYLELGEYEMAIGAAEKLLELEPENPRGFRLLYEGYSGQGNQAEADKALEAMMALDSQGDTVRIVFNEGVEALRAGDSKAARARFRQALELDPDLTPAMSALAGQYMKAGEYAPAAEMAERLLVLEPGNSNAMKIAFDAYKALGDAEKERQAFDRLLASGSTEIGGLLYESGIDLFNSGNMDGAQRNFEQALEADPSLAKAHYHLGLCLVNKGDNAAAREQFLEFLEKAPNDPEAPVASDMLNALD